VYCDVFEAVRLIVTLIQHSHFVLTMSEAKKHHDGGADSSDDEGGEGHHHHHEEGPVSADAGLTQLRLRVAIKFLPKSAEDSIVLVYARPCCKGSPWKYLGATEKLPKNRNPAFKQCINMGFAFAKGQQLKVAVWDIEGSADDLPKDGAVVASSKFKLVGECTTDVACVLKAHSEGRQFLLKRTDPKTGALVDVEDGAKTTSLHIDCDEIKIRSASDLQRSIRLDVAGRGLKDLRNILSKTDPQLIISVEAGDDSDDEDGGHHDKGKEDKAKPKGKPASAAKVKVDCAVHDKWQEIERTKVIKDNLNPSWPTITIPWTKLARAEDDDKHDCKASDSIKFSFVDWKSDEEPTKEIGSCVVTLAQLIAAFKDAHSSLVLKLGVTDKKTGDVVAAKDHRGELVISTFTIIEPPKPKPTLIDYIKGGTKISLMMACDFTGSNFSDSPATHLHYTGGELDKLAADGVTKVPYRNPYERGIEGMGNVLLPYDTDGKIEMAGFGAQIAGTTDAAGRVVSIAAPGAKPSAATVNYFTMPDTKESKATGVALALETYRAFLKSYLPTFEYYGTSTYWAPAINAAAAAARSLKNDAKEQAYLIFAILTDGQNADQPETIKAILAAQDAPLSIVFVGIGTEHNSDKSVVQRLKDLDALKGAQRDIVKTVLMESTLKPGELEQQTLSETPGQLLDYYTRRKLLPIGW
jgi:hypothetical protein